MLGHIGRLRHPSLAIPLSFSVLDNDRNTEKSGSCQIDSLSNVIKLEEFDVSDTVRSESV